MVTMENAVKEQRKKMHPLIGSVANPFSIVDGFG